MEVKVSCYSCGQYLVVNSSERHSAVNCPKCGRKLVIPEGLFGPAEKSRRIDLRVSAQARQLVSATTSASRTLRTMLLLVLLGGAVFLFLNETHSGETAKAALLKAQQDLLSATSQATTNQTAFSREELQSLKVRPQGQTWQLLETNGAKTILVTCRINNPTHYALSSIECLVQFWDNSDRLVGNATQTILTNAPEDSLDPGTIKDVEIHIPLENMPVSSISRMGLVLQNCACAVSNQSGSRPARVWNSVKHFFKNPMGGG